MSREIRKKSMDAVNEALLKPTEYPAADQDYNHPMWFKGTEPEGIKTGKVASQTFIGYHGTESKFKKFKEQGGREAWSYRLGFYFTANRALAKTYGPRIIEAELTMNKPFVVLGKTSLEVIAMLPIPEEGKREFRTSFRNENHFQYALLEGATRFGLKEQLIAEGYDGVVYEEAHSPAYIVFSPEQVKVIRVDEPEGIKTGSAEPTYDDLAAQAVRALFQLAAVATDEDVRACADASAQDLQYFLDLEKKNKRRPAPPAHLSSFRGSRRTAEIDIHTGPENGGNPNLLGRTFLDEDVKKEIKEEKGGEYKHLTGKPSRASLLQKKIATSGRISRSTP